MELLLLGLMWGLISAVSLPIGAVIGLTAHIGSKFNSALMAFGGGALLFALSIELFGHALHKASHHGHIEDHLLIIIVVSTAAVGGLLFQGLNHLLNSKGAFMRRGSLLRKYVRKQKTKQARSMLKTLSKIKLLQPLPPEEVVGLMTYLTKGDYANGHVLFKEGESGDRLYFIVSGKVRLTRNIDGTEQEVAVLGMGDVFGEIALVSDQNRTATAIAEGEVHTLELFRSDAKRLLNMSPDLEVAISNIAGQRIQELAGKLNTDPAEAKRWEEQAIASFERVPILPTEKDIQHEAASHGGGAAMAIWLGIALDGIPESLVIGMLVVTAFSEGSGMSIAFIVGVFLANLPEAMSSAVAMKKGGVKTAKIMLMWISLCIMTGIGALIGAAIFPPHPDQWVHYVLVGIEGLAGGAMLTMIAETMLPEAFEQGGGPVVGLSTLGGFLAALLVKLI